jgi:hypothetical protein
MRQQMIRLHSDFSRCAWQRQSTQKHGDDRQCPVVVGCEVQMNNENGIKHDRDRHWRGRFVELPKPYDPVCHDVGGNVLGSSWFIFFLSGAMDGGGERIHSLVANKLAFLSFSCLDLKKYSKIKNKLFKIVQIACKNKRFLSPRTRGTEIVLAARRRATEQNRNSSPSILEQQAENQNKRSCRIQTGADAAVYNVFPKRRWALLKI